MRYHLDEHVNPAIAYGLRRRGVDVTTNPQCGLIGKSDIEQLRFATDAGRVVFTQDEDFLSLASSGVKHSGIVYCKQGARSIGRIIEYLEMLHVCMAPEEMLRHVEFLG
jgi:predicted nuclease of predicted toxin-antitoxin system